MDTEKVKRVDQLIRQMLMSPQLTSLTPKEIEEAIKRRVKRDATP